MNKKPSYYLIGICGIGMSSLAQLIRSSGYSVRGSDLNPDEEVLAILKSKGIEVYKGHEASRLREKDQVVYSTAVINNPEYKQAEKMNLPLIHRTKALNEFLKTTNVISVTGTHGKTTTTYLLGEVLKNTGFDIGMLLGGISQDEKNNFIESKYRYVVELDESDGSFIDFDSDIKIVTSIDSDHLEFYQEDVSVLKKEFSNFLKKSGLNLISYDDDLLRKTAKESGCDYISFGLHKDAVFRGSIIEVGVDGTSLKVFKNDVFVTDVKIPLIGYKTAVNSLAVFALADLLNINLLKVADSFRNLKGVKRRYEVKFSSSGICIIEDYAHHPREIKEVIATIKDYLNPKRLIVVFQPHRYSRTKYLWDEFRECFKNADLLFLTDIYPAFEEEISGISSHALASEISGVRTVYVSVNGIREGILNEVTGDDIILILGAGDVNKISQLLIEDLSNV
ncbi:MAG: UDP-N-acetylmuramate--L-alanine ligase [Candidatus Saelkia tenebricola]|nr:UDP-N-acetylmuramate--L-alanine ligase [Candidatus Saelkia tenebricola]